MSFFGFCIERLTCQFTTLEHKSEQAGQDITLPCGRNKIRKLHRAFLVNLALHDIAWCSYGTSDIALSCAHIIVHGVCPRNTASYNHEADACLSLPTDEPASSSHALPFHCHLNPCLLLVSLRWVWFLSAFRCSAAQRRSGFFFIIHCMCLHIPPIYSLFFLLLESIFCW